MIRKVPDFPRIGLDFCHILGIAQHRDGLALSASLLKTHFAGDWAKTDAIVSCEAGGFVFAPALALQVDVALVLIREAGKLPPPTVSVSKSRSHISSFATCNREDEYVEMEQDAIPLGASVVVLDDVLATGETVCAMLRLLKEAGVDAEHISVMVVAEFPSHGGRELLRKCGFGKVQIQSLLVLGGA
jgi:adenine phosphoribosyltransferase